MGALAACAAAALTAGSAPAFAASSAPTASTVRADESRADESPAAATPPNGIPFRARSWTIPAWMRQQMVGTSWRRGCPVPLKDLRVMRVRHLDQQGRTVTGELVVHKLVVDQVASAFQAMYLARFPVARMQRIDAYGGSDFASIEANNTSAFNCRRESGTGSGRWSLHAYGVAIDINPIQNPFVSASGTVAHSASRAYRTRKVRKSPLQIMPSDTVDTAFASLGWQWGGDWQPYQDYQHFALPRSFTGQL